MSAEPIPEPRRYTVQEYFELEATSEIRHEYFDGQLIDMAGGSYDHGTIAVNLILNAGNALQGSDCRVRESNTRVQVEKATLYSYPDVAIVCGEPELSPEDRRRGTIANPRVVFEILSPGTEAWDRGQKFHRYCALPALREYVLVSQHEARVESFYRQDDGTWLFSMVEGRDAILRLRSVPVEIALKQIYAGVEFPPVPPAEAPTPS